MITDGHHPAHQNGTSALLRRTRHPDGLRSVDDRPPVGSRVALVGTYPPTRCGVASFTASLRASIAAASPHDPPDVIRVLQERPGGPTGSEVIGDLLAHDPRSVSDAATTLSAYRAVILQHEFGLYGPGFGRSVLDLVDRISTPLVVTLHTVTECPPSGQWRVVRGLAARADRLVVLSDVARRFLASGHDVDPASVEVIPHGTTAIPRGDSGGADRGDSDSGASLLTWGLIGPGKGLEWAILATDLLRRDYPAIRLVIAGRTHPKVVEREGEAYRESLQQMVGRLHLESHVTFVDEYLPRRAIGTLIDEASVVVLPYDSTEQTSSGVLVEAISAGVPVVATEFPQAVEMATQGAAIAVPHRDPRRLAEAISGLLADPERARQMVLVQERMAETSAWTEVGRRYLRLVDGLAAGVAV